MQDNITLLQAWNIKNNHVIQPCKTFRNGVCNADKGDSYPNVTFWNHFNLPFSTFDDYVEILEFAEQNSTFIAVRGKVKDGIDVSKPICRLKYDKVYNGKVTPATFSEDPAGHHWIMIDIDDLPNQWGTPTSKEGMVALTELIMMDRLPECFWNRSYWYQWSNSAAVKGWDMLKIHFWFLLSEPKTDTYLHQWARAGGKIDPAPINDVQANYISKPNLINTPDPFTTWGRSGVVRFEKDLVDLDYEYVEDKTFEVQCFKEIREFQAKLIASGAKFSVTPNFNGLVNQVSAPMRHIAAIGLNGHCHEPIRASACAWILAGGATPNKDIWKQLVKERIQVSGHPQAQARMADSYLDKIWSSAEIKFSQKNITTRGDLPRELRHNPNQF
jgi:hypothetical protein